MKLTELKRHIDFLYDNYNRYDRNDAENIEVCIEVNRVPSVGGTPTVNVSTIRAGFDFDKGKLIIKPDILLRETDIDEIKSIIDRYEELGWKKNKISRMMNENAKLKRDNDALKEKIKKLEGK